MSLFNSTNAYDKIWIDLSDNFKQRYFNRISSVCTHALQGIEDMINEIFSQAKIQRCIVHVFTNISAYIRVSDSLKDSCQNILKSLQS